MCFKLKDTTKQYWDYYINMNSHVSSLYKIIECLNFKLNNFKIELDFHRYKIDIPPG